MKIQSFPEEKKTDNYTLAVHSRYDLKFSDKTLDTYTQDALLQRDGNRATFSQNIHENGQT